MNVIWELETILRINVKTTVSILLGKWLVAEKFGGSFNFISMICLIAHAYLIWCKAREIFNYFLIFIIKWKVILSNSAKTINRLTSIHLNPLWLDVTASSRFFKI